MLATLSIAILHLAAFAVASPITEPTHKLSPRQFDGKTRLFTNGLGVMDAHYASVVRKTHNGVKTAWPKGTAPQWCVNVSKEARDSNGGDNRPKCDVRKLRVFDVKYDDCSQPWTFCRCSDAQLTEAEMIREFGRLPVKMRQLVRHVLALDNTNRNGQTPSGCGWAFNGGDNMALIGKCVGSSVWMHEASHSLDQGLSRSDAYHNAVAKDRCIPDAYAGASYAEDFAQTVVVAMNKANAPPIPYDTSCMANTLNLVKKTYAAQMSVKDTRAVCDLSIKRKNGPVVSIANKRGEVLSTYESHKEDMSSFNTN